MICPECSGKFDPAENISDGIVTCPRCMAEVPIDETIAATVCSDCGTPQRKTPSGVTCELGHGGVDGITPEEWEAKLQAAKDRAKEPKDSLRHEAMRQAARRASTVPADASASEDAPTPTLPKSPLGSKEAPLPVVVGYGESVSATWGGESFSPKQFNSFHVGPFSGTTQVRPGETHAQALSRLEASLEAYANEAYERKKIKFLHRLQGLTRVLSES